VIADRSSKALRDQLILLLTSYTGIGFEIKIPEYYRTSKCSVMHIPNDDFCCPGNVISRKFNRLKCCRLSARRPRQPSCRPRFQSDIQERNVGSSVASPKIGDQKFGGVKIFDFRRITLFCLEYHLSKHKMTICSENFGENGPLGPPGHAYGCR